MGSCEQNRVVRSGQTGQALRDQPEPQSSTGRGDLGPTAALRARVPRVKTRTGLGRRGRGRTRTQRGCEGLGKGAAPEDTSAQGSRSHDGAHGGQQRRAFYRPSLLGSEEPRGKRPRPSPRASAAGADTPGTGKRRHDADAESPSPASPGGGKRLSSGLS